MKIIERSDMQETMLHIKGNRLPPNILQKMGATVSDSFTIIKNEIEKDLPYPPEEDFRSEFVAEVKRRDKEYNPKESVICNTKEEREKLFAQIWQEDE